MVNVETMHHVEGAKLDQKCTVDDIHARSNLALDIALFWAKNIYHDRRDTNMCSIICA